MSRAVPEWIGKTDDAQIPTRVQLRVFEKYGGRCHCCGLKISPSDRWECDHIIALVNGGENRESNLGPMSSAHHLDKTRRDVKQKAKSARVRARHYGIKRKRSSFATNRDGKFKRRMDGTVERRR